jgi:hypothetical protein
MRNALFESLTLLDASGYVIIATIFFFLVAGIALTGVVRGRYASIERDLLANRRPNPVFDSAVLNAVVRDTNAALRRHSGEINTQAIIDHAFQTELRGLLTCERFVRASTGLMIILGLVGTFYGLTLSIGKLVALISGDLSATSEITESLTRGLSEALSGMSVAFSTSLVGIFSAIVMTLLGVFANVTDRRNSVAVQIEAYLDNVLIQAIRNELSPAPVVANAGAGGGMGGGVSSEALSQAVAGFGQTVARLEGVVGSFEAALTSFSTNTRDFQEFNLHLKDNITRMSLSFGDLSDALKQQAQRSRERG